MKTTGKLLKKSLTIAGLTQMRNTDLKIGTQNKIWKNELKAIFSGKENFSNKRRKNKENAIKYR